MNLDYDYTDKTILAIPDLHAPYQHVDALDFLQDVRDMYEPDLVVNLGDALDFHNISFHDSDPNLYNAGGELHHAQLVMSDLEKLFPEMYIIGSNHGDLPLRRFVANGLPRQLLKSFNEIYAVGDGWKFVPDLTIKVKGRNIPDLYFVHAIRKNALQVAQQRGQRFICGHFHENFEVRYAGNPNSLLWAVMSGCLIDKKSYAFAYNKLNLQRPILGCTVVEDGFPTLIPMVLDSGGRWIGEVL